MKRFIGKKWLLFLVIIILVVGLVTFLYCMGFRITYAPELENSWDAVSACAAWAGAIGTVAVLVYNHWTIKLTQRSVRQAIDLQMFEKRLELYNAIASDKAFYSAPLSLKIAYNEEIYHLYSDIVELCEKRWAKIWEFAQVFRLLDLENKEHGNVCHELYEEYTKQIENKIRIQKAGRSTQYTDDGKEISLENYKINTDSLHKAICEKYTQLEGKMRTILNQSIN